MQFQHVYLPISGFTENTGRETGTEKAWHRCRKFSGPLTGVLTPREWNADWSNVASLIARNTTEFSRIVVSAYSWGAGHGFLRLCEELNKRDRVVHEAILVDPVARMRFTPTRPLLLAAITNPLSLVGKTEKGRKFWPIKIPKNVRAVSYFRQSQTVPAGRQLKPVSSTVTLVRDAVWVEKPHTRIDEDSQVMETIYEAVERAVTEAQ